MAPPATPAIAEAPADGSASAAGAADAARPAVDVRDAAKSTSSSEADASSSEDEGDAAEEGTSSSSDSEAEELAAILATQLRQQLSVSDDAGVQLAKRPVLDSFDLAGIAALIQSGRARRIVCMCGAGISVSAGIPDFRSPGTGLYSQLEKYNLPYPHAVFELSYFRKNPRPFFLLARELFPGSYLPTPAHYFMRLLHDKGLLLRCFTQNIDSLEQQAGLPAEAVVAAHGNFDAARCIRCKKPHDMEHVRAAVFAGDGNPCYCVKKSCGGLVKPDIVFFGESLPPRFFSLAEQDFAEADLLIVMGTSLVVQPFAGLIDAVDELVPRLLINREKAGELDPTLRALGYARGFNFGEGNYRDALHLGDCDDGVRKLCSLLGWEPDLDALIAAGQQRRGNAAASQLTAQAAAAAAAAAAVAGTQASAEAALAAATAIGAAEAAGVAASVAPDAAGQPADV